MFRRLVLALLTTALVAVAVPGAASAATCDRYASPFGSDSAAGTQNFPVLTVQRLYDGLQPGQTGCLASGTYTQASSASYLLRANRGGSAGAPISVRSTPGQRATLRGIVAVPEGSNFVTFSDLDFDARKPTPDTTTGIQINANDVTIQDSDITDQRSAICMVLGSPGWGSADRMVLQRNVFHECGWTKDNQQHSVYIELTHDVVVTDNLFLRSGAYAVHIYPYAQGTMVTHNVLDGNGGGVIFAGESSDPSSNNTVTQNVITGSWMRPGIGSYWGSSAKGTNNLAANNCLFDNPQTNVDISGGGFTARDNFIASPDYRDAAGGDFRLGTNSQCLQIVGYDTAAKLRGETVPAPTPSPTPTPTTTAAPTATPAPTTTAAPTATPAPTSTPAPTATPAATSTPAPTATPAPAGTPGPIAPVATPPATATPVATVPAPTQPAPADPGPKPVEAAKLFIDDKAFSASGGSTQAPCPRKRSARCRNR